MNRTRSLFEPDPEEIRDSIDRDVRELRSRHAPGDITAGRHGGSPTSEQAHERISESSSELRAKVYQFIWRRGEYGATTDEIAEALGLYPNQISGRISELAYRENSVIRTERTRRTRSGSHAAVVVAKVWA
ncbi:MAG TPA: hypothetical protein VKS03_10095 [Thermoanaerobaculia bacterium]|nr:hypothetical protein [Thermoanaerobaculia bacterium]